MSNRVLDELRDMDKTDVLSFAAARHETRLQAERELLAAAYQWAVLHSPDRLGIIDRRARERARPAGADGTPLITEYAAATFGARIQTSPYGARRLIADAVDIHHRLPHLHAGLQAGTVRVGYARHVAAATRHLSAAQAAWVDAEIHRYTDGRLGWARFRTLLHAKVTAAAPDDAAARERAAALEHGVRTARVNTHGTATLTVRGPAPTILAIQHAIGHRARQLETTMPEATPGQRELAALAAQAGARAPRMKVYLHLTPDSPIARLEDHGPITRDLVTHALRDLTDVKIQVQPVIDLNHTIAVDAYEIPDRLREAVHLIHPADVFPFAANTTRHVDLDHAQPWAEGGDTSTDNLGPLTRTHHRIKTHAGWEARHPFPGITIWRDPHGAHYLVDPTGTRKITASGDDQVPSRAETGFAVRLLNQLAA